jgi:heterodisulfide reductase subunit C/nitrate reductase gamma subunit
VLTANVATIALGICLAGTAWRISRWLLRDIGSESAGLSTGRRLAAHGRALASALIHPRFWKRARIFLWEIVLQGHLLRQDRLRWAMHMAMCYGVLLLVFLHALDDWTAPVFFADYYPTLNPFRWLRNFFAFLVLAGVLGTAIRHRTRPPFKHIRSNADRLVLLLLAAVIVSGILLESSQILSASVFEEMVADYMGDDDPDEVAALRHHWATAMGAALPVRVDGRVVDAATGQMAHEAYCASCHSRPQAAFLSYPTSRLMKPVAGMMDALRIDIWLWTLHYLASCLALACLPFSKFFHLLATPVNLLARAAGPVTDTPPAFRAFRRALGLDACTHCGVCTAHCSVAPFYRVIPNTAILPSEKLGAVKRLAAARTPAAEMALLAEGHFSCTLCGRCTRWCPSGIDLQDLWQASRRDLIQKGFPPFYARAAATPPSATRAPGATVPGQPPLSLGLTDRPETFWACVQCTTCTSVCPVVAARDDPRRDLDLTPQQIMNLMRLQLKEQAFGCRMLWDCVTCYQCQEHCPQNVKVADVLYELRNEACRRAMLSPQAIAAGS